MTVRHPEAACNPKDAPRPQSGDQVSGRQPRGPVPGTDPACRLLLEGSMATAWFLESLGLIPAPPAARCCLHSS